MYFQIQVIKYSVCIHVEYFTTVAVTVYDIGHYREIQIVYNTGRQRPCDGLFLTRSATVGQVCRTALTTVKRVIDFPFFDLGGLPLGQRSPKGEMTYYSPRSAILQNFSPIAQTVYEICATKVFFTFWRWFWPLKVIQGQSDGANGKPVGPTIKCSRGPISYLSPFSRYFESKFWLYIFWPWSG